MITIGTRIKYLRLKHGMTMKQLGEMLGFPETSADVRISQYEHDSRTPKAELVNKLAEIFGVDPDYLLVPVPITLKEIQIMKFWQEELGLDEQNA